MDSIYQCICSIFWSYIRIEFCCIHMFLLETIIWFSTNIDSILCVPFVYFVRCTITTVGCRVWIRRSKDECSSSPCCATSTSFKAIYFVRCATILFNIFMFTILIGKAPQECFAGHTTSYVRDSIFAFFRTYEIFNICYLRYSLTDISIEYY